jgi:hypothetical protein
MDNATPDVTTDIIGAEWVGHAPAFRPERRLKTGDQALSIRFVGGKIFGEHRSNEHGQEDDAADQPDRIAGEFVPQTSPLG